MTDKCRWRNNGSKLLLTQILVNCRYEFMSDNSESMIKFEQFKQVKRCITYFLTSNECRNFLAIILQ